MRRRRRRRSRAVTVPPGCRRRPGPRSSVASPTWASCGDRWWDGGCGHRARRTGRPTPPTATPGRGTPRPKPRSCWSTPGTTPAPATATRRSPSSGSATPCCSPWTAGATRATRSPASASTEARMRYLVELITPPPGTLCQPDKVPFP